MRRMLVGLFLLASLSAAHAGRPEVGVYVWAGADGVKNLRGRFIPFWGTAPHYAVDFAAFDSWKSMEGSGTWVVGNWKGVVGDISLSVPLTVKGTPLEEIVEGKHDESFRKLARALVDSGFPRANVRIGWEMNAGWYPWGNLNDQDPAKQAAKIAVYKAAFAHVAHLFRSVSPGFRINWCPAGGNLQLPPTILYPGDEVVDEVGLDLYAQVWGVDRPTPSQVETLWHKGWQLEWIAEFARAHGKPFSFPEFGVGDRPQGAANYGPGDNAEVARYAVRWMQDHAPAPGQVAGPGQLSWVGLWDVNAGDYNSQFTGGARPNVAAAYKEGLGR